VQDRDLTRLLAETNEILANQIYAAAKSSFPKHPALLAICGAMAGASIMALVIAIELLAGRLR
jgi:hypothetical protein